MCTVFACVPCVLQRYIEPQLAARLGKQVDEGQSDLALSLLFPPLLLSVLRFCAAALHSVSAGGEAAQALLIKHQADVALSVGVFCFSVECCAAALH
jgi:hypothetical protein